MKIGIQGQPGSACDEAASLLIPAPDNSFEYLTDAERTLAALAAGLVDCAVLAAESPIGVSVPETAEALTQHPSAIVVDELRREVRHCIMVRHDVSEDQIRKIASHSIPLEKHRSFLEKRFPGYEPIVVADPGLAAQLLAQETLTADTAVVAMPRAAELFNLQILERELPANDNYLTRFVVMKNAS